MYEVIATTFFQKNVKDLLKKYASILDDVSELIVQLSQTPDIGDSLGGNIYKVRLQIKSKGKGKRSGARVITYFYRKADQVYLITIYDKSEYDTLAMDYIQSLVAGLDLP
jgi:hypothetical protein